MNKWWSLIANSLTHSAFSCKFEMPSAIGPLHHIFTLHTSIKQNSNIKRQQWLENVLIETIRKILYNWTFVMEFRVNGIVPHSLDLSGSSPLAWNMVMMMGTYMMWKCPFKRISEAPLWSQHTIYIFFINLKDYKLSLLPIALSLF